MELRSLVAKPHIAGLEWEGATAICSRFDKAPQHFIHDLERGHGKLGQNELIF